MAEPVSRRDDAERRMRQLAAEAGLPEPDEVIHHADADELEFRWYEQKLAVVVELGDDRCDAHFGT